MMQKAILLLSAHNVTIAVCGQKLVTIPEFQQQHKKFYTEVNYKKL